jgi:dipeptidyl aminopeptidase/acylaminoacyl peptidase
MYNSYNWATCYISGMREFIFDFILMAGVLLLLASKANAQLSIQDSKPLIDTSILGKWPEILSPAISNDGKYSSYIVYDAKENEHTLYIVKNASAGVKGSNSNRSNIAKKGTISSPVFSADSKYVYFMKDKDSLGIITLKTGGFTYIHDIKSFSISHQVDYVAYLTNNKRLFVKNILTGEVFNYNGVKAYRFSEDGNILLLETMERLKSGNLQTLHWIELHLYKDTQIWKGENLNWDRCEFNPECNRLAFLVSSDTSSNDVNQLLYYYENGKPQAENIVNEQSAGLGNEYSVKNNPLRFSRDGDKILFSIGKRVEPEALPRKADSVNVDVWNYKDEYLQSDQLKRGFNNGIRNTWPQAVINISNRRIVRISTEGEDVIIPKTFEDYLLVDKNHFYKIYYSDSYDYELVSVNDGAKTFISDKRLAGSLSPDDSFFVWFDYSKHQYFSYETFSGEKRCISASISVQLDPTGTTSKNVPTPYGIVGWHPASHSVLLFDKYDIWKVDLLGKEYPMNLTNGIGRKNNVVFGLFQYREGDNSGPLEKFNAIIDPNENILLTGFDVTNKNDGFWIMSNSTLTSNPSKLLMDSFFCTGRTDGGDVPKSNVPLKARFADRFLVMRQSANEYPNLFVTSDFKTFNAVSDIHPEKPYNWLTSELISWKMIDGDMSQGVLYKPENFDPNKRYPVIFYYYVKQSNELHAYKNPEWCMARINIPYFVSNGYLVFMPDIYYKPGRNGPSIVNSVVSAARYLSTLPFVDSTRLGLQGHSFAGWETNYLVTHSHIFAAACTAAGFSDQISGYYQLAEAGGLFPASYLEIVNPGEPYGLGVTPSTRPDLYEENSPVLAVEAESTPLLIVAGNLDEATPFRQGLEMYLAMRRAGKKTWLLQYEDDGHILSGKNSIDYTVRLKQFFDYYLKGCLPPFWMTRGIPASLKGRDLGFSLDTSGAQP